MHAFSYLSRRARREKSRENTLSNLKIKQFAIDSLIPYAGNARTHDEANVDELAATIQKFGFNNPILIDQRGVIVAGHGRWLALRKLGWKEAPCIVLDKKTDAELRAMRLADNKLAEKSKWDFSKLAEELEALRVEDYDFAGTGFSDADIAALLGDVDALITDTLAANTIPERDTERTNTNASGDSPRFDPADPDAAEQPTYEYPDEDLAEETPAAQAPAPTISGDEFSQFSVIMKHGDKLDLMKTLNRIREEHGYEQLAHALVYMREVYEQTQD